MDAAARPLPSDDTTPPVTRMYFTGRLDSMPCNPSLSISTLHAQGAGEQPPHPLEVVRRVHAERVVARFHRENADAVLQRAQLLERFGLLERGALQRRELQQAIAAVDVQADVPPRRRRRAA